MPNLATHRQQAQHNLSFLEQNPDRDRFGDWAVTTCFYVAVQYIDAWLSASGSPDPDNHGRRYQYAQERKRRCRTRGFDPMWEDYRDLETLSRNARYECIPMRPEDVDRARNTFLAHVQRWVEGELRARGCGGARF